MRFKITFAAGGNGEGIAAEVIGGVCVEIVLVPPGLFCRVVELEGGHRVDVDEGGDGADVGSLHGGEVGEIRGNFRSSGN